MMAEALTLDFRKPITKEEKFNAFHLANPHVFTALETATSELIRSGHNRIGIDWLIAIVRWENRSATTDAHSIYKINNDYKPRYARLLRQRHPEWSEVIVIRELRSA